MIRICKIDPRLRAMGPWTIGPTSLLASLGVLLSAVSTSLLAYPNKFLLYLFLQQLAFKTAQSECKYSINMTGGFQDLIESIFPAASRWCLNYFLSPTEHLPIIQYVLRLSHSLSTYSPSFCVKFSFAIIPKCNQLQSSLSSPPLWLWLFPLMFP